MVKFSIQKLCHKITLHLWTWSLIIAIRGTWSYHWTLRKSFKRAKVTRREYDTIATNNTWSSWFRPIKENCLCIWSFGRATSKKVWWMGQRAIWIDRERWQVIWARINWRQGTCFMLVKSHWSFPSPEDWDTCQYKGGFTRKIIHKINPFYATGLFPYFMKTSEIFCFSDVFREHRKIPMGWNRWMNKTE